MNGWHLAASPTSAVLGALVLALCLRAAWRSGGLRRTVPGWALLLGAILAVGLALRPERDASRAGRPGRIVLLRDASGSMATPVAADADEPRSRADLAVALCRDLRARLEPGGEVLERTFGAPVGSVAGTDLHAAIVDALTTAPAAIVLLSDGEANASADPRLAAQAAAAAPVPLLTVCLGDPEPQPTLAVTAWTVPEPCTVGDLAILSARVANSLPQAWDGEIEVTAAERRVASCRLRVGAGQSRLAQLRWRPEQPGPCTLTVRLPRPPGDAIPADNQRTATAQVTADARRILAVDGQPRWEFRHALQALRSVGTTRVQTLLLDPVLQPDEALPADLRGEDIAAEDSGADRLPAFPAPAELQAFDLVVLGAVPCHGGPGALSAQAATEVCRAVAETGLGLILLPGPAAGPAVWAQSPLAELLPVQPAPGMADAVLRSRTPATLRLLPDGSGSAVTALGTDPDGDADLWRQLPGLQRYSRCGPVRPGSVALLAVSAALGDDAGVPLVVFRTVGLGRVLYIGSDQLWRWRGTDADSVHARFWQGAARTVARPGAAAAASPWRLLVEGAPALVGMPVRLHAIPDARAMTGSVAALNCTLRQARGAEVRLTLTAAAPGQATRTGEVRLPAAGAWEVWLDGASAAAATLTVLAGPVEAVGEPADPELLAALAGLSGGQCFGADASAAVAVAAAACRQPLATPQRQRPWTQPAWAGLAVLLLGLGWALRPSR